MNQNPNNFEGFAQLVLDALLAAEVEYLIAGSFALWAWGVPRTTYDLDLVVDLPFEQVYPLSAELGRRDMLVPPDIMVDLLLLTEGDLPINAIHLGTGLKAELFLMRPDNAFRMNAFARRVLADLGPPLGEVYVHAPEDLILNKAHYYSLSYQTKHVRDIAGIMALSRDRIDTDYIEHWADSLRLTKTWRDIQQQIAAKWGGT